MKKVVLTLIAGFLATGFLYSQVLPLNDQIGSTKGAASRGTAVEKPVNSATKTPAAVQPATKGGTASRGGYCEVIFDNWTNYYIDCYVNNNLQGYVAPWGKGTVTVSGGDTKVFGEATFDDGSKLTWGPQTKSCNNQEWTVTLY